MSSRTLFLLMYRAQTIQRAHFGIWVADSEGGDIGTKIHVVGNPMIGFVLQFKRKYDPKETAGAPEIIPIGNIDASHVHIFEGERSEDTVPPGDLEIVASQIPPPRASENFLAPVNDVSVGAGSSLNQLKD